MGQKVNPIGLRLGINRTWDSRWFAARGEYSKLLHEDMAIRDWREFRLVLIPSYGIVSIFLISLPTVTAALWAYVSKNVALFWVAVSMGYVVSYEWLHLSYHLPADNPIARSRAFSAFSAPICS